MQAQEPHVNQTSPLKFLLAVDFYSLCYYILFYKAYDSNGSMPHIGFVSGIMDKY